MVRAYDCWSLKIHRNICRLPSSLAGAAGCLRKRACLEAKPPWLSLEKCDGPWCKQSAFLVHNSEGWQGWVSVIHCSLEFFKIVTLGDPKICIMDSTFQIFILKNPKVVSLTHLKGHGRGLSLLILLLYWFVIYGLFLFTVRMFCNFPASCATITYDAYRISIIALYATKQGGS